LNFIIASWSDILVRNSEIVNETTKKPSAAGGHEEKIFQEDSDLLDFVYLESLKIWDSPRRHREHRG